MVSYYSTIVKSTVKRLIHNFSSSSNFPVVQFGFESVLYSAAEGESQGVEVVVVKYGSSALNLSVGLSTADGTAMSAQDYTRVDNQELAFSPMERSKSVRIGLINDNVLEGDEQFSVSLGQLDPKARIIEALNFTTIVITDDDSKCKERNISCFQFLLCLLLYSYYACYAVYTL